MKFAVANGEKIEASKGSYGCCPICHAQLIEKYGEKKINHWAHKGNRDCDSWWENETEWHRSWKGAFPKDSQEVVHKSTSGEKHIADVKTKKGWAIEFQFSYIEPEERRRRSTFYSPKLIWVVNCKRKKNDIKQFQKSLKRGSRQPGDKPIYRLFEPLKCSLLNEWQNSDCFVFLDFEEINGEESFWFLFPKFADQIYLVPFSRELFIKVHNNNEFYKVVERVDQFKSKTISDIEEYRQDIEKNKQYWIKRKALDGKLSFKDQCELYFEETDLDSLLRKYHIKH